MVSTCGKNLDKIDKNCMKTIKSTFWGQNRQRGWGGQAPVGEILLRELFLSIIILSLQEQIPRSQPQSLLTC